MNWDDLIEDTLFFDPKLVDAVVESIGTPIIMPKAFRGTVREFADQRATHNNGYPVRDGDNFFALWAMRPSRDVASIAAGLSRRDLEKPGNRVLEGRQRKWTPHHIYQCGIRGQSVRIRARLFTNLANLVLIDSFRHQRESLAVHSGDFAQWLEWVLHQLYGAAAAVAGDPRAKPKGSPELKNILVLKLTDAQRNAALLELINFHRDEPGGSKSVTAKLLAGEQSLRSRTFACNATARVVVWSGPRYT